MFRYPFVFLLVIPIVPLIFVIFRSLGAIKIPNLARRQTGLQTWRTRVWWLPEVWLVAIGITLIFLLAGPQKPLKPEDSHTQGLSLAVVLDRSGSMGVILQEQKEVSRFDAVKDVLKNFLARRTNDAVSLLSFAKYPETHTPLTVNPQILQGFLDLIPLATEEAESGTAIGDALVLAAARLKQGKSEEDTTPGIVLLLTDGRNNAGKNSPDEGAKILAEQGVRLYTIGLGGQGYYPGSGSLGGLMSLQGVDLDVEGLTRIAKATGGAYFQADDPTQLDALLKTLEAGDMANLKKSEIPPKKLDLEPGLWLLVFLLGTYPWIRYFLLKRGPQ